MVDEEVGTTRESAALRALGIWSVAVLGEGTEARTYAYGPKRVVKFHKESSVAQLERLRDFYEFARTQNLPFAVPSIERVELVDQTLLTVERRIAGTPLAAALPRLSLPERRRALEAFLVAREHVNAVLLPHRPYGELLEPACLEAQTWAGYLRAKVPLRLEQAGSAVREDVPHLDEVVEHLYRIIDERAGAPGKSLVHGDYFPGNVMIDDSLRITGVLDFSGLTVVGDPAMDIAGAVGFLGVLEEGVDPANELFLRELVAERYGWDVLDKVELYLLFYAISFLHCRPFDPGTYRWSVGVIDQLVPRRGGAR